MEAKLKIANDCLPSALGTESNKIWNCCVEALRTHGYVNMTVHLMQYDEKTGTLTFKGILIPQEMPEIGQRNQFAKIVRNHVRSMGANAVLTASDVWIGWEPDQQEALQLTVELRDVSCWGARQTYTHVGDKVFIPTPMPTMKPEPSVQGRFAHWWGPTPMSENN